ncbi:hypothetical protein GH733_016514 [Mirounga leonina]|nr:hypothetical protein GH733_016514 [Mirounga leonina]
MWRRQTYREIHVSGEGRTPLTEVPVPDTLRRGAGHAGLTRRLPPKLSSRCVLRIPALPAFSHGQQTTPVLKAYDTDKVGLLRQHVLTGSAPARRGLHTSSRQADSSRAWLTRVHRQAYARLYPVLLVKQDGSTVHIRYREPRRVLEMPVDLDTLSPEERRTRLRKRETQLQKKKEEKPELSDDFDEERYKRFWTKK